MTLHKSHPGRAGTGSYRPKYLQRGETVKVPRLCIGFDTADAHVPCKVELGHPVHKMRCSECALMQDRYRRARRKKNGRKTPPLPQSRVCVGHDTKSGPSGCSTVLHGGNRIRCENCALMQKRWRGSQYDEARYESRRSSGGARTFHGNQHTNAGPRRVTHWCGTCAGIPWRRDVVCPECLLPYAPERVERGSVLGSSMAMTVVHKF